MGVFLRVFDPKGYRNPYKGSDWRKVERQKVEPIEPVRAHRTVEEDLPATAQGLPEPGKPAEAAPPEPGEQEEEVDPQETTVQPAKVQSKLEEEFTDKHEFYGPGDFTGIAADMMVDDYPTIESTATISEAAEILKEQPYTHLPVVTKENKICGLITEKQIFQMLFEGEVDKKTLDKTEVNRIMITPVLCCVMETPLFTLMQTMIDEKVGALPIVDSEDNVKGVITKRDLIEYLLNSPHFKLRSPKE